VSQPVNQETLEANKYVHSLLVETGEYQRSPHFRPENIAKVRALVVSLTADVNKAESRAIDFGCGTGFMIDLMKDRFGEVHGVDITQAMMKEVDLSSGNVFLHEAVAERTPFVDDHFDFATAYSFMDHLFDAEDFLKEVHRVLKPGGVFFSGLNPNRDFIAAMDYAEQKAVMGVSPIVTREIKGALHNGDYYAENFGVDGAMLDKAEPIKALKKGFDAKEIYDLALDIGFSACRIDYDWFLGQGKVMHDQSFERAEQIHAYLSSILPVASPLYKYLNFIFTK
jgi:SAM-dependent methyltransferase